MAQHFANFERDIHAALQSASPGAADAGGEVENLWRGICLMSSMHPQDDMFTLSKEAVRIGLRAAIAPASEDGLKPSGVRAIDIERNRQIGAEGWTPEHDDEHANGEMAAAALGYVQSALGRIGKPPFKMNNAPSFWPWDVSWWKPKTPRDDLVRAGALIAAEIDRLDRLSARTGKGDAK